MIDVSVLISVEVRKGLKLVGLCPASCQDVEKWVVLTVCQVGVIFVFGEKESSCQVSVFLHYLNSFQKGLASSDSFSLNTRLALKHTSHTCP